MSIDTKVHHHGHALRFFPLALGAALLVALIYWPAVHASFVWDDLLDFHEAAWLRHGNDWLHYIMRGFNNWSNYFRPLAVVLFTFEVRIFDVQPGPMHAVSIVLHLINMVLVGIYARILNPDKSPNTKRWYIVLLPMLLYGLHPLLIEPVTWIGCQFDLMATLFMLLGLVLNARISRIWIRALCVALCFFLAACSKESAVAFPFLLLLSDWFGLDVPRQFSIGAQLKQLVRFHWPVYVLAFAAGVSYLIMRHIALGRLVPFLDNEHLPLSAHIREVSFLYVRYWHMFFWPMDGMSPVHPVPIAQFLSISASSIFDIVIALGIFLLGFLYMLRRHYVGGLIMVVTFALLPVLHILPGGFDQSLYHERYAMPALAMACAWLPATLLSIPIPAKLYRVLSMSGFIAAALWIAFGSMNVRATIPLWSTPLNLWQSAFSQHPNSIDVEDALISTYIDVGYKNKAWVVIDKVVADNTPCVNCRLNAANLAISENKLDRAAFFLDQIKESPDLHANKVMYRFYLTTRGELELLQGDAVQAEKDARDAISLDNLDPNSQLLLAMSLAKQGKLDEANEAETAAVSLSAPDERNERRSLFDNWLKRIQVNPVLP